MSLSNNIYPVYKKRFNQNLASLPVYINDNSLLSPNYFAITSIPSMLTAGKNIIKLKANNKNLKLGSELLFEVIDAKKNIIYSETSNYLDRTGNRIITIYVYPDATPGIAQITLVGIATKDLINTTAKSNNIPISWQNKYNIKWTYKFQLDPLKRNETEILLNAAPTISVNEVFKQCNIFTPTYNQ